MAKGNQLQILDKNSTYSDNLENETKSNSIPNN